MFKVVPRELNLTGRVTSELEALIVGNRLQPGDRLPAVRELAEQYGVSRTVIREAIGALAARGLLEVRHGSGTVVSRPSAEVVTQSMRLYLRSGEPKLDYAKVSQVRRILEVEIASLAAENRTPEDLAVMEENVGAMAQMVSQEEVDQVERERFVRNDLAFHDALAQATHNELFPLILNSIADIMFEVRQLGFYVPGAPSHALEAHRLIFERVRAGDPAGARQAMEDHLEVSAEILRQGIDLRRAGEAANEFPPV
jgi:GntR family transcriptional regulator, transcriptional repressor for pyruvate dehydrogenase complex